MCAWSFHRVLSSRKRWLAAPISLVVTQIFQRDGDVECLERRLQDAYQLLEPERPLGVGGHGVVFPGVNRSSGEIMAIKQVSKKFVGKGCEREEEALKRRVTEEAEVLRVAGEHRSICSYKELFEGEDAWYIVTELARGGELFDRLVERGAYTASGAASVMFELVDAVAYLHQMGIAHLDLKPENVLLASDETDASDVRLVDFGSARFVASLKKEQLLQASRIDQLQRSPRFIGTSSTLFNSRIACGMNKAPAGATPAYAAPEVLCDEKFDEKADIWSLGVILYLLLTGTHPFDPENDADDQEVTRRVIRGAEASGAFRGPDWQRVPLRARGLLKRLLASNPEERPSAAEVSSHPWLLAPDDLEDQESLLDDQDLLDDDDHPEEVIGGAEERTRQAVDKLRQFHRGRRRFKALLLAVMLGYADDGLVLDRGAGTACLGSRRAAMEVFDADNDGLVTAADVKRVAKYVGEDLSDADVDEMLRALDKHAMSFLTETGTVAVPTSRLRHLLPPLYPAHCLRRGDLVFHAGETDPRFYVLLKGDVLVSHSCTIRPRSGFVGTSGTSDDKQKDENTSSTNPPGVLASLFSTSNSSSAIGGSNNNTSFRGRNAATAASSSSSSGRELSLGLHRLRPGQSFGETELLDASVADALPRASTATCASGACDLLSIPGHLFQLLSDVFDGVQDPLRAQAEARARMLVWSWVSALVSHAGPAAQQPNRQALASRSAFGPGESAWKNHAYAKDAPLGKSLDMLQRATSSDMNQSNSASTAVSGSPSHSGTTNNAYTTEGAANLANIQIPTIPRRPGAKRSLTPGTASGPSLIKPSRYDSFLIVEDGVVEVTVADPRTGARKSHTLWPKDFVYCNERAGNHPLDARQEFASTIVLEVNAVTQCQIAYVPGDVFQQALNQPAMQFVKYYLVERFRELPPDPPTPIPKQQQQLQLASPSLGGGNNVSAAEISSSGNHNTNSLRA